MRKAGLCLLAALALPLLVSAAEPLQFEVATVKPVDANITHLVGVKITPGARVLISGETMRTLVAIAYHLGYWQISGGESWIEKEQYDIEAVPPKDLRTSIKDLRYSNFSIEDPQLRQMLQALLSERFQLRFHRETRTGDIYILKQSGKTLRLRPSAAPRPFGSIGFVDGSWSLFSTTMTQLAKFAADYNVHTPVSDQTGLTGSFDYRQTISDPEPNHNDPSASFLRLVAELGLKLERDKGPVETLVIDHAVRPSPN